MTQPLYYEPQTRRARFRDVSALGGPLPGGGTYTDIGDVPYSPLLAATGSDPGVVQNMRSALSGAARRPVGPTVFQNQMIAAGVPRPQAEQQAGNPPVVGMDPSPIPGLNAPPFPASSSRMTPPSMLSAAALGSPPDQQSPSLLSQGGGGMQSRVAFTDQMPGFGVMAGPSLSDTEPYSPSQRYTYQNPGGQAIEPRTPGPGRFERQGGRLNGMGPNSIVVPRRSNSPGFGDSSGGTPDIPGTQGPSPSTDYPRPPLPASMPRVSGNAPAPSRQSPLMEAASRIYTPEGELADAVARMDMTPDPAYVAQAREAARQLGQQRYAQSNEGQVMIGRTEDLQRRYNPTGRPDYESMTPMQAAMVSQNTYRSGGRAGAMGGMSTVSGAMRDREDAIAMAQQNAGPPRPSNGMQVRESRGMMQGAVTGELERMGGQYNPNISFENNARGMSPGTTFTGETSTGVPVIVSRGSASPLTEDQQLKRDDANRKARQDRAGRMAELGQRRMAQLQQERDYAMDPVNRLAMAAMGDPRAAATLGGGIMNSRVGMGQNQVAAEGLQRQIGLDASAEQRASAESLARIGLTEAQIKEVMAKTNLISGAGADKEAWARGVMASPEFQGMSIGDQKRFRDLAFGGAAGTVSGAVSGEVDAPATTEEAIGRLQSIAPQASAALGIDIMTSSPDDIIAEVQSRVGTPAEIKPEDMAVINESIKLRGGVDRKLFDPPGLFSQALGGFFAGPYALPGTDPGAVRSGIIDGIKGGSDLTMEAIKAADEENRKKMEARNRMLTYPRMGPG
jgi:hypothetical protein